MDQIIVNSERLLNLDLLQYFGLLTALIVLGVGVATPLSGAVDGEVQLAFSVFLATVVLWITKPVPYVVSSLLSVVLLYGLGLTATFQDAVIGFASTLVFFFVLLLLIGKSVAKVNLDDWVANRLVTATSTPRVSVRRLATTLLLLAFIMPSAVARTVTFVPVIDRINDLYDLGEKSNFRRLAYYVIGHVNPLTSLVVMTGGGMPITTSELVNSSVRSFTWIEWVIYMAPPIVLLYSTTVVTASFLYRVDDDAAASPSEPSIGDGGTRRETTPLTTDQKIVVLTLLVAIVLWIVGSFVGIPAIIPAMFVVTVVSLPGVRILTVKEIGDISWGIVFLMGAMLSLLQVMRDVGAFDLVIDFLFSSVPVFQAGLATIFVVFLFAVGIRSTLSSVSAALILLLPVLLEFASLLGVNQLYVALSLPIVLGSAVFLPFNIPTVLIAYERGPLTRAEVLFLGLMTLTVGFLTTTFGWLVYWPTVERLLTGVF